MCLHTFAAFLLEAEFDAGAFLFVPDAFAFQILISNEI